MTIKEFAILWGDTKSALEHFLGLSPDAMHVQVSIVMLLFYAVITRRRIYDFLPWILTFVTEVTNELIDLNQPWGSVEANWPASRHDILNTMFLPTLIVLVLRWRNKSGKWRPKTGKRPV